METGKKYTDDQAMILNQTSMVAILASLGYDSRKGANGLYLSPFRSEKVGSLHINDYQHVWCDHGGVDPSKKSGKPGGNTIQFVMAIRGCGRNEALDFLSTFNPNIVPVSREEMNRRREDNHSSRIRIISAGGFTRRFLLDYATSQRRIPQAILCRYCREVAYQTEHMSKPFFGIGFPNSLGGWAVRNNLESGMKKFSCTPGGPTVFGPDGTLVLEEGLSSRQGSDLVLSAYAGGNAEGLSRRSDKVVAFEGFFDYLSWLSWNQIEVPGMDAVILNSTSNLNAALPFLLEHNMIWTMLDNDRTGRACTEAIMGAVDETNERTGRSILVLDAGEVIDPGKDLAQMYVEACRQAEVLSANPDLWDNHPDGNDGIHI